MKRNDTVFVKYVDHCHPQDPFPILTTDVSFMIKVTHVSSQEETKSKEM